MSKAGQNTITGISDQADITLFYLLKAIKYNDFNRIVIEGDKWDDFTLIYNNYFAEYEVKSYSKPLTISNIKRVISKKLDKQFNAKDRFYIIAPKLSKEAKEAYEYIHNSIYWIHTKKFDDMPIPKKLFKKNWTEKEILFLANIEIVEFGEINDVHRRVSEYFAYEFPFYLDEEDQKSIIARSFKDILIKGKSGGSITKGEFNDALQAFKKHIEDQPTPFNPILPIGKRIINLKTDYLNDSTKFKELNHRTYLNQLTAHPRLIFYLCDELQKGDYEVKEFNFFIDKVLLKECYIQLAIRLLKSKWDQKKVSSEYLVKFIIKNYKILSYELNYDEALNILKGVAEADAQGFYQHDIVSFLKRDILHPFNEKRNRTINKEKKGWREDEHVAGILEIFLNRTKDKRDFIDFIFKYYDFTSDNFANIIETHPRIYTFVKGFIKEDLKTNYQYVIKKISKQFDVVYDGEYGGYEWVGSGVSQMGSSYSITDIGIVRLLFQPLFSELYIENSDAAWQFFKDNIINKDIKMPSKNNPLYLKRALIPILIKRLTNQLIGAKDKEETFYFLEDIMWIQKGLPRTSEIVFYALINTDLQQFGFEKIMALVNIDTIKYRRKDYAAGYPTNLFVVSAIVKLIKLGYRPAKDYFISLIKKQDFAKYDNHNFDSFELIVAEGIPDSDPDFIVEIFNNFEFEKYLNTFSGEYVWDKSGLITGLIKKDWVVNATRGQQIVASLLGGHTPGSKVLEFLAGPIRDLSQADAAKTYELFIPYIKDKETYWRIFQNNSNARESIVSMAEDLIKIKLYKEAQHIVELCIEDPDPNTDSKNAFNHHAKIKSGEEDHIVTSVRGKTPWALQGFVVTNDQALMSYAFQKIKTLIDLDGCLAKKLGYSEPDLYVRQQALVPFIELSHPWRRNKLNEYKSGLGDNVKKYAFDVLDDVDKQFRTSSSNPKALLESLVRVFSNIRDLNIEEAKIVLAFFETREVTHAHFLFTYYAEFIEDPTFDSTLFKDKLSRLCATDNPFREILSWEYWRIADEDDKNKTNDFIKIESYWKLLFNIYQNRVFDHIYNTIEIMLKHPQQYTEYKGLFKKALETEINYHIKTKQPALLWEPGIETFHIIKDNSIDDFLEIFFFLLEKINSAIGSGINIHYSLMKEGKKIFQSISPSTKDQTSSCDKIKLLLDNLYADIA